MTVKQRELRSSACTLSDMEIFIFPELLYALVLANILSPEIWKWREDKWFRKLPKMSPLKKIQRVKQYIMDHYDFNLDLETWGLTDKLTEIARFRDFIDPEVLKQSNALFGYEGDRYYFDIDIRRHFGLDKYDSDIIPYWKTETVEAMNAFRHKPSYEYGAGECVSLAALYAAALFVVAEIPLSRIFLMATPLHSQNFVLVDEGVITNNRRIVTKNMWFNGTELSTLARRALEHEKVTMVSHISGHVHTTYPDTTIDHAAYLTFRKQLQDYLTTDVDFEIFINFLRVHHHYQPLFEIGFPCCGGMRYVSLSKAFGYEHGSKHRLGDKTALKLLREIEQSEMSLQPDDRRILISAEDPMFVKRPWEEFLDDFVAVYPQLRKEDALIRDLKHFVHLVPRLPVGHWTSESGDSQPLTTSPLHHPKEWGIEVGMNRGEILEVVLRHGDEGSAADDRFGLSLYAGRFMDYIDWDPFLHAAITRNPVSLALFRPYELSRVVQMLHDWPNESIYEGNRLALPDEVVNFGRGDGIEKALVLSNVILSRDPGARIVVEVKDGKVGVEVKESGKSGEVVFDFVSGKSFQRRLVISSDLK